MAAVTETGVNFTQTGINAKATWFTAAMLEPYDTTGDRARLYFEPETLQHLARGAADMGHGVIMHAIGDWTVRDEAITAFLSEQGAAGVPLYLWYAPGASAPEQLPQVLTPELLETQARQPSGTPRPAASAAGSD